MGRPKKCRRVCSAPGASSFLPENGYEEEIIMSLDEYETVRLLDWEGMTQEQCAGQMGVARATITMIYDSARKKIADALVHGKKLTIGGGDITVCENAENCCGRCGMADCSKCGRMCRKRSLHGEH